MRFLPLLLCLLGASFLPAKAIAGKFDYRCAERLTLMANAKRALDKDPVSAPLKGPIVRLGSRWVIHETRGLMLLDSLTQTPEGWKTVGYSHKSAGIDSQDFRTSPSVISGTFSELSQTEPKIAYLDSVEGFKLMEERAEERLASPLTLALFCALQTFSYRANAPDSWGRQAARARIESLYSAFIQNHPHLNPNLSLQVGEWQYATQARRKRSTYAAIEKAFPYFPAQVHELDAHFREPRGFFDAEELLESEPLVKSLLEFIRFYHHHTGENPIQTGVLDFQLNGAKTYIELRIAFNNGVYLELGATSSNTNIPVPLDVFFAAITGIWGISQQIVQPTSALTLHSWAQVKMQVDAFKDDPSPEALEKLFDKKALDKLETLRRQLQGVDSSSILLAPAPSFRLGKTSASNLVLAEAIHAHLGMGLMKSDLLRIAVKRGGDASNTRVLPEFDRLTRIANRPPKLREGESVEGATILLIDDVLSSGATAAALTTALMQAGAKRVIVLALSGTGNRSLQEISVGL